MKQFISIHFSPHILFSIHIKVEMQPQGAVEEVEDDIEDDVCSFYDFDTNFTVLSSSNGIILFFSMKIWLKDDDEEDDEDDFEDAESEEAGDAEEGDDADGDEGDDAEGDEGDEDEDVPQLISFFVI